MQKGLLQWEAYFRHILGGASWLLLLKDPGRTRAALIQAQYVSLILELQYCFDFAGLDC